MKGFAAARVGVGAVRRRAALLALAVASAASLGMACDPDNGDPVRAWRQVFTDLPAALLGVWGSGPRDVWAVGADAGEGPWVLHFDGERWRRLTTGQRGTLWWVTGVGDRLWMAGEAGLVLRHDRASDRFTRLEGVPANVTLYGIQETPEGSVWTVGGNADGGRVFRLEGATFVEVALPEGSASGRFFKVWGRSDQDLWVVGLSGKALHRDAGGWQVFDVPGQARLTTVHGNASVALAVGGFASGAVFSLGLQGPVDTSPSGVAPLNGVWVSADGGVVAVGAAGTVLERRGTVWRTPSGVPGSLDDYHAVYVDHDGGVWAVGGFLLVEPQRRGMLLHYGEAIGSTIE